MARHMSPTVCNAKISFSDKIVNNILTNWVHQEAIKLSYYEGRATEHQPESKAQKRILDYFPIP